MRRLKYVFVWHSHLNFNVPFSCSLPQSLIGSQETNSWLFCNNNGCRHQLLTSASFCCQINYQLIPAGSGICKLNRRTLAPRCVVTVLHSYTQLYADLCRYCRYKWIICESRRSCWKRTVFVNIFDKAGMLVFTWCSENVLITAVIT